jgi:iron-only hydrogenase group A
MDTAAKINLTINSIPVTVPAYYTVLLAARKAGIDIPTLCYLKGISETASCRICVVEVDINGVPLRNLPASCVLQVQEGMNVRTNTPAVREAVRTNLALILANHNRECLTCKRNQNCELQALCDQMGMEDIPYSGSKRESQIDNLSYSIVRDASKYILCGRCVDACRKLQGIGVLDFTNRGFRTEVAPAFDYSMRDVDCTFCGQCIQACPVAALRRLGFDKVFDTNFSADLTIMEEGAELLQRLKEGGKLPMITSCSPGWIRYCEMFYPDFLDNLSSCKSPQQMFGAIAKSYYAEIAGIDPKDIVCVSIMPCTAKKAEAARPEMEVDGVRDVDFSLTTRELAAMIRRSHIRFLELPDELPDKMLGEGSGAGVIFGATGGVMEAALRTIAARVTDKELPDIEYQQFRGLRGVKEATVVLPLNGQDAMIKGVVAHGTANAKIVLDAVKAGEMKDVAFIEIMACPGGCVHGGGQPYVSAQARLTSTPKSTAPTPSTVRTSACRSASLIRTPR